MCVAIDSKLISVIFRLNIFNLDTSDINFESIGKHDFLKSGNRLNNIGILFKKIEKKND